MTDPNATNQATPASAGSPLAPFATSRSRWLPRFLMTAAVVVVFGPVTWHELAPSEMAKWRLAAAREHDLSGRSEQALANYEAALRWHPEYWLAYQERSNFHASRGRYAQALADFDKSLERFPLESRTLTAQWNALGARSTLLLHLKRYDEALDVSRALVALSDAPGWRFMRAVRVASAKNGLAYYRAVANRELDEGLKDIDEVLGRFDDPAFLDTRGFLYYRLGRDEEALEDIDRAVELQMQRNGRFRESDDRKRGALDPREAQRTLDLTSESLAVMLYHRALVLQELGRSEEAEGDLERVRDLGFEPGPDLF